MDQTESLVRDASPFNDTSINGRCHGRFCRGESTPTPMWVTEVNMAPDELGLCADLKACTAYNRKKALAMKAKIHIRYLTFYPHKGVERVYLYNDVGNQGPGLSDSGLSVVSDAFVNFTLQAIDGAQYPTPAEEAQLASPSMLALKRLFAAMSVGDAESPSEERAHGLNAFREPTNDLALLSISEKHGHMQWDAKGSGDPARFAPLYNRELFVWLPMRVNETRYVALFYVMTRNITDSLADEAYELTLSNIPQRVSHDDHDVTSVLGVPGVECFDPLLNTKCNVSVSDQVLVDGRKQCEKFRLVAQAVDYPRLLTFDI